MQQLAGLDEAALDQHAEGNAALGAVAFGDGKGGIVDAGRGLEPLEGGGNV